jgi:hypothetical protein
MATTAAPEAGTNSVPTTNFLKNPPRGFHWEFDEVKTDRGQKSLGEVPILTADDGDAGAQALIDKYGSQGVCDIYNGTSGRVSFQAIARRLTMAGKTAEDIAAAQVAFAPGKRQGGQSTPASRVASEAKKLTGKVNADAISELLAKVASGEINLSSLGIKAPLEPVAVVEEEEEEVVNGPA